MRGCKPRKQNPGIKIDFNCNKPIHIDQLFSSKNKSGSSKFLRVSAQSDGGSTLDTSSAVLTQRLIQKFTFAVTDVAAGSCFKGRIICFLPSHRYIRSMLLYQNLICSLNNELTIFICLDSNFKCSQ